MAEVSKYLLALVAALTWLQVDAFVTSVERVVSSEPTKLGSSESTTVSPLARHEGS